MLQNRYGDPTRWCRRGNRRDTSSGPLTPLVACRPPIAELIERVARPGTSLFTSWDQYWANVRIGLAFQTDSLEQVQRFDHILQGLRASGWPAARAAFPTSPVPDWLPRTPAPGSETPAE